MPPPFEDWGTIRDLLDRAVTRGGNDWAEVEAGLADGRAQLWLGTDGNEPVVAGVSRIDGDTLEIWLVGGMVLSGFVPSLGTVIAASKEAGTTNGRITGRKGWRRVLQPFGWRPMGEDLVKEWANEI